MSPPHDLQRDGNLVVILSSAAFVIMFIFLNLTVNSLLPYAGNGSVSALKDVEKRIKWKNLRRKSEGNQSHSLSIENHVNGLLET